MSEVLRRTIFVSQDNSSPATGTPIRTMDWATVITALGQMWEPFVPFQKRSIAGEADIPNHDFSESMHRVDEIQFVEANVFHKLMTANASGSPIMGGTMFPRVGA